MEKEMTEKNGKRLCLNCGKPLTGRPDKVFCCVSCKNEWHNHINGSEKRKRDQVFRILWSNYKLLELLLDMGSDKAELHSLTDLGFRPEYMTGHVRPRGRRDEYYCMDIRYNMTEARLYNIRRASIQLL